MPARLRAILYALGGALTAFLVVTTTAAGGAGVGANFTLGQTNSVDAPSILTGATSAPQLTVKNTSTSSSATALSLVVASGRAPFRVNSEVKVPYLNADKLDGKDSTGFYAAGSKVANADKLDGIDSTGFLSATGTAVNSDKLDSKDSTEFWQLGGNAPGGTAVLGTNTNQAIELDVNGERALRLEPDANSPNVIGGFSENAVQDGAYGATIAGGGASGSLNIVKDHFGTIGGGFGNTVGDLVADPISAEFATVGGGLNNTASSFSATVGGGYNNAASGDRSVVAGGVSNTAEGTIATVAGGGVNTASGENSAVGGGVVNTASGAQSTVAGGQFNHATGERSAVLGGSDNTASGIQSTVAGGVSNTASGNKSFAAGYRAKATEDGSFVWGDSTVSDVTSPAANTFTIRAAGGIWLGTNSSPSIGSGRFIDTSTGGYLTSSGVWTDASDRALKHDFRPLNTRSVLERVARMPITSWSYKSEKPSVRHIGPMAQDFYKAFGLGLDDKHIGTIDEGGVALAAIKGLYRQNQALERRNRALNARVSRLERMLDPVQKGR
jgi:hypothetical protein